MQNVKSEEGEEGEIVGENLTSQTESPRYARCTAFQRLWTDRPFVLAGSGRAAKSAGCRFLAYGCAYGSSGKP